jgi:hypothetical protein
MPYMLLIVEPTGQRSARSEAEGHEAYASMQRFAGDLKSRGLLRAGARRAFRGDRWAVRRSQGNGRRLFPGRLRNARGGCVDCGAMPGGRVVHGRGAPRGTLLLLRVRPWVFI